MVDEASGLPKVIAESTLEETLLLEDFYVEAKPLWMRRTNYFKEAQGPNGSFEDW